MTDVNLKKLVVAAVALTSLLVWATIRNERPENCTNNCSTDLSSQRR
jgi:hypothetical protein